MDQALCDLELEYYADLDRFCDLCHDLIDAGQAYTAVWLCHELYRFLYPGDPYAGFRHQEPVPFLSDHIRRLIALGCLAKETIRGYKAPESNPQFGSQQPGSVETATSDLYSDLWEGYDHHVLTAEGRSLIERRIPGDVIDVRIAGHTVLDMGCGSGRYSIALALLGARSVTAVDFQAKSFLRAEKFCSERGLPVRFLQADVLHLPFEDRSFDFVFCNGVLHHTRSWQASLSEYARVMGQGGFLYLYATGGFFWTTRRSLRRVFQRIPREYTAAVLKCIGMPSNRMVFLDTWYVPIEEHIHRSDIESALADCGLSYHKLISKVDLDLDCALEQELPGASAVWGEGEHRYLVSRYMANS